MVRTYRKNQNKSTKNKITRRETVNRSVQIRSSRKRDGRSSHDADGRSSREGVGRSIWNGDGKRVRIIDRDEALTKPVESFQSQCVNSSSTSVAMFPVNNLSFDSGSIQFPPPFALERCHLLSFLL